MKFIYILNSKKQLVDSCRVNSDRYNILNKLILLDTCLETSIEVRFDITNVKRIINELLEIRRLNPSDHPDYDDKFYKEINLFQNRKYDGKEFLFCQTGFDNKLIFLINIYDSIIRNESPYFLIFTRNHKEFQMRLKNL